MSSRLHAMPPRAETLEQLERWLLAFYQELVPDKLANVPKIAKKMMHDQPGLDSKLKAAYNKGLRYAAHLAGDAQEKSKRKFDSQRGSSRADFFPTKRVSSGDAGRADRFTRLTGWLSRLFISSPQEEFSTLAGWG